MRRFRGRDYLDIQDFDREELIHILDTARQLKLDAKRGVFEPMLRNRSVGLLFDQPSTRTRISFELGVQQMGGIALYLRPGELHLGKKENICDTARVMSRFLDAIMIRWNDFEEMKELARYADIPVINGMSDVNHPCQALADVLTMMERFDTVRGLNVTFMGDGTNVSHSLAKLCTKLGINYTQCGPRKYWLRPEWTEAIEENCRDSGSRFNQTEDVGEATRDCHVVYTDVWWWIGQEAEEAERRERCMPYQVTEELLSKCDRNVIFEHCLPALRGVEVTDEVMDGPRSAVYDQAENRLHTEKALMALLIP
ncbi:MAG: ornithine carbamoyltransferase [Deltaproteobacteria bacterium]|nr:ornithine carbamoyltransferase [Deltaproteobacteria bacterium]MBW2121105.1 ornithine carbamoyltransferase [Deltaproteobacteria bacterium]